MQRQDVRRLSIGVAKRLLDELESKWTDDGDVIAVGVGIRDNQPALILSVRDMASRDRVLHRMTEAVVGGLPVFVEPCTIHSANTPFGLASEGVRS